VCNLQICRGLARREPFGLGKSPHLNNPKEAGDIFRRIIGVNMGSIRCFSLQTAPPLHLPFLLLIAPFHIPRRNTLVGLAIHP